MSKQLLTYQGSRFYLNGAPFRILSGTIHYFRVVPEYWEDRLRKLKACGFNTVETYTCWNLHEPKEGQFCFEGMLDLVRYIKTAQELGLYVILRPGPYICAEWDMGGLPSWLLTYEAIRLRCHNSLFLEKVRNYYHQLFSLIRPLLGTNGGNIIAMQVENEYGSYGDDHTYMQDILDIYRDEQIDCLLFTSDGPGYFMLNGGSIPGLPAAVNFGSNPKGNFELLRRFAPDQPLFCCEYWNGWFDHWYEEHHVREADDTAGVLEEMLRMGASVNLYMFHGGTNFAFYNGANYDCGLQPTVTSYDYNCPLNESGDITPKYEAIRTVITRCLGIRDNTPAANLPKHAYGTVSLTRTARMFEQLDVLSHRVSSSCPLTMEQLGQDFGFVLYSTTLKGPFEEMELTIDGLHDRALIYLNGKLKGIKERTGKRNDRVLIGLPMGETARLDILVENLGRINYGPKIMDAKGITGNVRLGPMNHFGWDMYPIDCKELSGIRYQDIAPSDSEAFSCAGECVSPLPDSSGLPGFGPVFLQGTFSVTHPTDTFVRPDGFEKGNIFINGFNLGRYWNSAGPQKTLYLPAPLLKEGINTLTVLELEQYNRPEILLTDQPDLG